MSNSQVAKAFSSLILINGRECISRSRRVYHCLKTGVQSIPREEVIYSSVTCTIRFTTPTMMKLLGTSSIIFTPTLNGMLLMNTIPSLAILLIEITVFDDAVIIRSSRDSLLLDIFSLGSP